MANNENLLKNAADLGLGVGQAAANILNGGQLGAGYNTSNLDAATPLTFSPTVLVVLQTPKMYAGSKSDTIFGKTLKSLIETHAKQVTGIDFGYTLEVADQPFGHDGQNIQVPTQTKRSPVNPSFVFHELKGNLVWNLFNRWILDIQDADTNGSFQRFDNPNLEFVSSAYAMSMLAIQYDPTMQPDKIIDAAFYTNMFPTDPGGQIGFERTIGQTQVKERTVTFSGIVLHNKTTRKLGVKIAGELSLAKAQYDNAVITPKIVNTSLAESGLAGEVKTILDNTPDTVE